MPIKAYIGLQRSGKTYEVASVVIYNALKQGRRVVSNIAGLNQDEYFRLLTEEGCALESLGHIVQVTHEQPLQADFWLNDVDSKAGKENFIKAGDLVVLDEIWRFWDGFSTTYKDDNGNKMPTSVTNFFRMHGHFSHPETGLTCELAIITQDITDCSRKLRGVIEETYRMTKLTVVGSTTRYRIDVFSRSKITKTPLRSMFGQYDEKYFKLYVSHSQKKEGAADPREQSIDKRGNILSGKIFVLILPLMLIMSGFSFWYIWNYFHPKPKHEQATTQTASANAPQTSNSSGQATSQQPIGHTWVIKGYIQHNGLYLLTLENEQGAYRYVSTPDISFQGIDIKAYVDGVLVTNWQPHKSADNTAGLTK